MAQEPSTIHSSGGPKPDTKVPIHSITSNIFHGDETRPNQVCFGHYLQPLQLVADQQFCQK